MSNRLKEPARKTRERASTAVCKIHEKYYQACYYVDNNSIEKMFNFVNEYPVDKKNMANFT